MSNLHFFQRYSQKENTVTNNTLSLLSFLHRFSPDDFESFLKDHVHQEINVGLNFKQQTKAGNSIPDGCISQETFTIHIETKLTAEVDPKQLINHARSISNKKGANLLLISKEKLKKELKPEIIKELEGVNFGNVTFDKIAEFLGDIKEKPGITPFVLEVIEDYLDYLVVKGLVDTSDFYMRIVPCGNTFDLNMKYGVYYIPDHWNFRRHRYVGIYNNKCVSGLINCELICDYNYHEDKVKNYLKGDEKEFIEYKGKIRGMIEDTQRDLGWKIQENHKFFCGPLYEITFKKESTGGIRGARYYDLRNLKFKNSKNKEDCFKNPVALAETLSREENFWK